MPNKVPSFVTLIINPLFITKVPCFVRRYEGNKHLVSSTRSRGLMISPYIIIVITEVYYFHTIFDIADSRKLI